MILEEKLPNGAVLVVEVKQEGRYYEIDFYRKGFRESSSPKRASMLSVPISKYPDVETALEKTADMLIDALKDPSRKPF